VIGERRGDREQMTGRGNKKGEGRGMEWHGL